MDENYIEQASAREKLYFAIYQRNLKTSARHYIPECLLPPEESGTTIPADYLIVSSASNLSALSMYIKAHGGETKDVSSMGTPALQITSNDYQLCRNLAGNDIREVTSSDAFCDIWHQFKTWAAQEENHISRKMYPRSWRRS